MDIKLRSFTEEAEWQSLQILLEQWKLPRSEAGPVPN